MTEYMYSRGWAGGPQSGPVPSFPFHSCLQGKTAAQWSITGFQNPGKLQCDPVTSFKRTC